MQIQTKLLQTKITPSQKLNNPYDPAPAETSATLHDPDPSETSTALHDPDPSEKLNHLHQKFVEYGKNAKEWMRKCVLLLPEIEKHKVWKKKGFSCIYEYAAKLAGMSRGQVDEALYILGRIENKPALRKVVEAKGINAVRPVVAIATEKDQDFWAKKAMEMSHHTLATYVKEFRNVKYGNEDLQVRNVPKTKSTINIDITQAAGNSKTLTLNLKPEIVAKLEKFNKGDWNELMQKFIDLYEKNLEQELKQEKPAPVANTSEHIPQNIQNYVLKRSHGKCEFPNCNKTYDHLHHTNRYSSNKIHDPDQIVALCEAHHDLAHKGLINDENNAPRHWQIQKEPDYTNLNRYVDEKVQFYRRR